MNTLFLCGIYPLNHKGEIMSNSIKGYQFAAQNFQEAIIDGFIKNNYNLTVVSKPFLSSFPIGYKKAIVNFEETEIDSKIKFKNIFYINLPFIRTFVSNTKSQVLKWCISNIAEKTINIIVYSLNADLMKIALDMKKRFINVRLSIIVLDLPEYMGSNRIYNLLGIKKREIKFIYENISKFEKFILLTEAMRDKLGLVNESYCVVEGIYKPTVMIEYPELIDKSKEKKNILYTGALVEKYGIEMLLSAFNTIEDKDLRLIICGDGEAKELVKEYCERDSRIIFKGKVPHEKILFYQKTANLLVNPRPSDGDYTKYSFPSKTMEYLASGAPVLMFRLPGVPDEYFDYCFTLDMFSKEEFANKISYVLSLDKLFLQNRGKAAIQFIQEEKNSKKQVGKIIDLIEK
ncbi:glycosyltransferase [Sphingobacterium kyonggiense]